jgi:hypothetical protein
MSLEQAIQQNTDALNKLIALMEAARTTGCQGSEKVKVLHAITEPTPGVEDTPVTLTYDDVKKPFLKLVTANRDAALGIMAHFNVTTMQKIPQTQEAFAEAIKMIEEAANV